MFDIHTHILPMLDDGAQSVEEALQMLIMAYEDGTDDILLTPHMALCYGFDNPKSKTKHYFQDLKRIVRAQGIPIHLHLGMELLYTDKNDFEKIKEEIKTLNDTSFLLCEFFFDCEKEVIMEAVKVIKENGFIPVIAHPERYECMQRNIDLALWVKENGAYLQMNAGSLTGFYGRRARNCVYMLLEENLIDFVGSDAHDYKYRTPLLKEGFEIILDAFGRRRAEKIFFKNAYDLLLKEEEGIADET